LVAELVLLVIGLVDAVGLLVSDSYCFAR
jgi:hypothetical protein